MRNDPPQQTDDKVSHRGKHPGAMPLAHLGAILVEGDIAHPMETVLDAPMAPIERQQLAGRGLLGGEVGDDAHPFGTLFPGFPVGDPAFDQTGLADVGEIEIAVQRGGGADRALLDAPMGLIECGLRRGE